MRLPLGAGAAGGVPLAASSSDDCVEAVLRACVHAPGGPLLRAALGRMPRIGTGRE